MSDNLPKELRVNPVSIDDVKDIVKEAIAKLPEPKSDDVEIIEESTLDNLTADQVVDILKRLYRGEVILKDDDETYFLVGTLTSKGIGIISTGTIVAENNNPIALSLTYWEGQLRAGLFLYVVEGTDSGYKLDVSD